MKKIIFYIAIVSIMLLSCGKNPNDVEEPLNQEKFLEDVYQEAVILYEDSTSLNESFKKFNSVIERDSCGCFWNSYIYISNIYLKWDELEKAKEVLLSADSKISSFPDYINHIKEKRLSAIRKRLKEIFQDTTVTFSDSLLDVNADTNYVFVAYDEPPQSIGGFDEIQRKIKYPQDALDKKIEGTVIVNAFVCWRGRVCKSRVLQKLELESLNYEARRVLREVKWKPARQRGRIVEVWVSMPIKFMLN